MNATEVVDDGKRFVLAVEGFEAELTYRRGDHRLVLIHTGVPAALEGRGLGGTLVRSAAQVAREEGLTLVPRCRFARAWLRRHPDALEEIAVDWPPARAGTRDG